ncbi:chlororespiratory reduction 6 domain-containing protein [Hymenobacter volaticus]|uniref:Chlororespiratory reduction 6 domain-containing protein n=1 Tax=Hymenobacter volaticus TaxID=2932254 RepID=A0ABY4G1X7_9BACT|nr:chlororespiratory reduction 6 domain-containing protein [Hymenobacter volaticus]UOQ64868.1 chlororespiratory reduction 6 domain-containing protein [Hymenobacter volaticus]
MNYSDADIIMMQFDKKEIEDFDVIDIYGTLLNYYENPREVYNKINIVITGYDNDSRELFEIPEVRKFFLFLDNSFPYWFYWLNKDLPPEISSFFTLFACICPVNIKSKHNDKVAVLFEIEKLMVIVESHFHYYNKLADASGISEEESIATSDYILKVLRLFNFTE